MPAPTTTEREATKTEWNLLEVCCDAFESAVGAGVLQTAGGRVYLRQGSRAWYISRCPWCGEERK
jgi:hypothetical protein